MDNVYELTDQIENCTHAKLNFVINTTHVNADLGIYKLIHDAIVAFTPQYTSAVIEKTKLISYVEN